MASPVFCPDETFLRKRLKLSTVQASSVDTDAVIDQAVLEVRVELFRALGVDRIAAINAGASFSETADTAEELLVALGVSTEINWCRSKLLRTLNPLWMEGSGSARNEWNETPLMRKQGSFELKAEIERLDADISSALAILRGDVALGAEVKGGEVFLAEPLTTPPLPGRSVWPPSILIQG